jgi:chemotaxis protein histidine kinase CheA
MTPDAPVAPAESATPAAPPKRSPGHRGTDIKDTIAEMTARANEITLEAGSKMANALRNILRAAIGSDELSVDATRDVVDYFRRRHLMSADDAQALLDEVAEAAGKKKGNEGPKLPPLPGKPAAHKVDSLAKLAQELSLPPTPGSATQPPPPIVLPGGVVEAAAPAAKPAARTAAKPAAKAAPVVDEEGEEEVEEPKAAKPASKTAAKAPAAKAPAKPAAKAPVAKAPATKAAAKAPAAKAPAAKAPAKPAAKSAAKPAAKKK